LSSEHDMMHLVTEELVNRMYPLLHVMQVAEPVEQFLQFAIEQDAH
jgi:hypothetical protein